ncbi:MAG TPA: formimidoylglutamase [Bacteroidia bacterium]|nr:formimidoylglutamase [Bacteroidia bacterium]
MKTPLTGSLQHMHHFKFYSPAYIKKLTRKRDGEYKVGDRVLSMPGGADVEKFLCESKAKFVLVGIAEDIGVRANYGRTGAQTAWMPALENILNLQHNFYFKSEELLVLGEIDVDDLMEQCKGIGKSDRDIEKLRKLVEFIDARVIENIEMIAACGKIPVVIGGGHNNSYPIIKAVNEALRKSQKIKRKGINVINCDAHADFRPFEGRHSGNGFSYAFEEGILNKYAVFGLHEQYNVESVLTKFKNNPEFLYYNTYEDVFVREKETFAAALGKCIDFCKEIYCGVELDLDAITNVPSSARTSCGISPLQARQYVYRCAKELNPAYLHIAEGAPVLSHIKADYKTGKLIAYLVSDFMKAVTEKN